VANHGAYRVELRVDPNRAAVPNSFAVRITRAGKPVDGADVTATFTMLEMAMGSQAYRLSAAGNGVYRRSAPALVMVGRWGLSFEIRPPGASPFSIVLVDRAAG
jgi:copper transport protein